MTIHRRLLGRGVVGAAALPYLIVFEWLAPVFVAFGLGFIVLGLALGFLNLYAQVVVLALVLVLAILMSLLLPPGRLALPAPSVAPAGRDHRPAGPARRADGQDVVPRQAPAVRGSFMLSG